MGIYLKITNCTGVKCKVKKSKDKSSIDIDE